MLCVALAALTLPSGGAMANHAVSVELFYDGDWNAAPTYTRDGITLSRGAPGEGQDSPPSSATATFDNRTGAYNPRNVTGPLYGLVGRNTPMRVSADGSVRSTTEVASWGPDRTLKGTNPDAWTSVQGGGILRRIQQGKTPLKSSLERAIIASNPVAFWPLSDGKEATALLSGIGGEPLTLYGARPGEVEGPVASGASFVDIAGGLDYVSARGPAPSLPAAGWGVEFMVYIGERGTPEEQVSQTALIWYIGGRPWKVNVGYNPFNATPPNILIFEDNGSPFVSDNDTAVNGWNHCRVTYQQVGGNVQVEFYLNGANVSDYTIVGYTLASTSNEVIVGQIEPPTIPEWYFNDVGVAHLAFYALADAADHSDAAYGYVGEPAGVRFLRVAGEEGVAASVIGDEEDTQPMGSQSVDTFINILRECVRTDDGLLFEPRDDRGVVMRTGRDRYNQSSVLDLNFTGGQIAPGLVPVLDDQNTRNDVTATRRTGGSFRAQKTSGPMNISDPLDDPEGIGRVDTQVDVNPETDDMLVGQANWHLHKGTVDEARYPQVTVDLDAAPSLISAVNAVEIGDRITITNLPTDWQYGPASLLVLGVKETFPSGAGDFRRKVTFNTIPASAYEIGIVGANDGSTDLRGQAVDTDNSTLGSGINNTATSLSVASTGGTVWTTDSNDWNPARNGGGLYIVIGGEEMRVTNITGASSPQTFTVVRSTNGVVKSHLSGAPVHVRYPIRVGL